MCEGESEYSDVKLWEEGDFDENEYEGLHNEQRKSSTILSLEKGLLTLYVFLWSG